MNWQTILYLTSILLTCALSGFLAAYAWKHRQAPGSSTFAALALSESLWTLAEILSVFSPSITWALFWFQVRYLFGALIGVCWFVFALEYNGRQAWLSKRLLAGLFVIPLLTQALLWSNSLHGLWATREAGFTQTGPFWIADTAARTPGLGYLTHAFYILLLTLAGIVLLFLSAWKLRREFIAQALLLAGAGLTASFFLVNALFNLLPKMEFNPFTPGLGLSLLLIALAVFRFEFLKRAPVPGSAPRLTGLAEPERRSLALLLLFFLLLVSGIFASAYLSSANYEREFRAQMDQQLSAIVDLKVAGLVDWRAERLGDAEVLRRSPAFAGLAQAYLESPSDARAGEQLQAWFDSLFAAYQYDRVFLLDTNGLERLASPKTPEPLAAHLVEDSAAVLASGQTRFMDFHRNTTENRVYLAVLVPIYSPEATRRPLGTVVLRINPETSLYPYLEQWPAPSESAETLLVRREGDSVLFLNPVRFRSEAALNLRFPLTETDILAVKAVLGQTGVVEGRDYRGEAVLGALAPIPGTPWLLVARMDASEVYAPLRERLWQTVLFYGILLLSSGTGLLLFWRQQRVRYYQAQAETAQALRDSETRYRRLFEAARDGILILEADTGVIINVNPFLVEMLGLPREEILGKELWELGFFKDIAENRANFLELQQEEYIRYEDLPLETANGQRLNVEFVSNVYQVDHHRVVQCNIRDITERKLAESLTLQEKNFNQAAINSLPGLFYLFDEQGHYLRWNKNYEQVSGYSGEEIGRMSPLDFFNEPDKSSIAAAIQQVFTTGEVFVEGNFVSKNQAQSPYFFTGQLFWFEGKRCLIGMGIDITERKRAQDEVYQLNATLEKRIEERTRELREAQESLVRQERLATLGQVAGSIAHELRNPLGVISNAVYYLEMALPDMNKKTMEYLGIIEKETRNADKIITDLLDFTRIKSMNRRPVSVSELVHQTLERHPAPPSIEVRVEIPADLPQIYADPQQVAQVLANLVVNACQAMVSTGSTTGFSTPSRGQAGSTTGAGSNAKKLTVAAARQGDMIRISVTDTGPGILPENLAKLFQPLFTTKTKGIGLGLAVSQKLVEANGGRIEFESVVGQGSAFIVVLPVYHP
jgi:PAS domain S-box-containing protein